MDKLPEHAWAYQLFARETYWQKNKTFICTTIGGLLLVIAVEAAAYMIGLI